MAYRSWKVQEVFIAFLFVVRFITFAMIFVILLRLCCGLVFDVRFLTFLFFDSCHFFVIIFCDFSHSVRGCSE